ncbi:uncharacterized protein METZ01_LOCUS201791 [marine metagenome]|uniref:Uncharacterized protein n=1 Tax=marine metagenome TaxID=408172 RepID=A0A382EGE0_9ZZZZ
MMFEYFPTNYPWSMATVMAVNAGGVISEIDEVLSNLRDIAGTNDEKDNYVEEGTVLADYEHG